MADRPQGTGLSLLADQVGWALSPEGPLARQWPGFKPRQGQSDMAQAVTEMVEAGGSLVVEAGTGVGKTFAYLVPVLLSGQRALVSTATKAQEGVSTGPGASGSPGELAADVERASQRGAGARSADHTAKGLP